eukprot:Partr_v1_DN26454_c1_g1_i9_m23833 putative calcium calmodulin-dependent protein kinase
MKKAINSVFKKNKSDRSLNEDQPVDAAPSQQPNVGTNESLSRNDTLFIPPRAHRIPHPSDEDFVKAIRSNDKVVKEYAFDKPNYTFLNKVLGTGAYGSVKLAIKKDTGQRVAIKEITKKRMVSKEKRLREEIEILLRLSHPNVLHLLDWGLGSFTIYLVTELAGGGELFDEIMRVGCFYESDAATVIATLFDALKYVHSMGIVHRDLKPENIFLRSTGSVKDYTQIVIGDFGISRTLDDNTKYLKTKIGSSGYIAPEVLMGREYGTTVDVWSLGVITFILLCGKMPFHIQKNGGFELELQTILSEPVPFDEGWDEISTEARSFVENCLQLEPKRRVTAETALLHPWIAKYGPAKYRKEAMEHQAKINLLPGIVDGLNAEKMRLQNLLNAMPEKSASDSDSIASGATSGWGSATHSRAGSVGNSQEFAASINDAAKRSDISQMMSSD